MPYAPPRLHHFICILAVLVLSTTGASAEPLEAVFFDLGDTLVESTGNGTFTLRTGAAETLARLQELGTQLGIITNVPAGWTREDLEAILKQPEILDEFDVLVLSSEAPAPKPDPAIYTFAHEQLPSPVPIAHTAFVGESLGEIANSENDPTEGARAVGMLGIHLSDAPPSPLADVTIPTDDLPQIVELVASTVVVFTSGFESGNVDDWSSAS